MKKTLAAATVAALVGAAGAAGAADMYPGGLKEAPAVPPRSGLVFTSARTSAALGPI